MNFPIRKKSYTVACASRFRDAVEALAARRGVNVADIARSVLLLLPGETVAALPDPGGPAGDDRESVVLKTGPGAGRPWRRKPRLQARLPDGFDEATIRRALGLALALAAGERSVRIADPAAEARQARAASRAEHQHSDELERLRTVVAALSFTPLSEGVRTRDEALHVLGFAPGSQPEVRAVRARFRVLATIHHPDSAFGSHERMSQLNAAMDVLRAR